MTFRRRLTTKQRRELYNSEAVKAKALGLGEHPICNISWCKQLVLPGQAWDESHDGVPHAFGGNIVGVAHSRCNRLHGAKVVTPMVAKSKRVKDRFLDITRTFAPIPGGRNDDRKRGMNGVTVYRDSGKPVQSRPWVKEI